MEDDTYGIYTWLEGMCTQFFCIDRNCIDSSSIGRGPFFSLGCSWNHLYIHNHMYTKSHSFQSRPSHINSTCIYTQTPAAPPKSHRRYISSRMGAAYIFFFFSEIKFYLFYVLSIQINKWIVNQQLSSSMAFIRFKPVENYIFAGSLLLLYTKNILTK